MASKFIFATIPAITDITANPNVPDILMGPNFHPFVSMNSRVIASLRGFTEV